MDLDVQLATGCGNSRLPIVLPDARRLRSLIHRRPLCRRGPSATAGSPSWSSCRRPPCGGGSVGRGSTARRSGSTPPWPCTPSTPEAFALAPTGSALGDSSTPSGRRSLPVRPGAGALAGRRGDHRRRDPRPAAPARLARLRFNPQGPLRRARTQTSDTADEDASPHLVFLHRVAVSIQRVGQQPASRRPSGSTWSCRPRGLPPRDRTQDPSSRIRCSDGLMEHLRVR